MLDVPSAGCTVGIAARTYAPKWCSSRSRVVKIKSKGRKVCTAILPRQVRERIEGNVPAIATHPAAEVENIDRITGICRCGSRDLFARGGHARDIQIGIKYFLITAGQRVC